MKNFHNHHKPNRTVVGSFSHKLFSDDDTDDDDDEDDDDEDDDDDG